jgi:transcription elongation factor GreA
MTEQKVPMTPEGYARLNEELKHRTSVDLPEAIKAVAAARERGDSPESAEYHAAAERREIIVERIASIEELMSRAEVIDPAKQSGSAIQFGAKVKLQDVDTDEEVAYQIVGPEESDARKGLISVWSPLARALLGHEVGDEVDATTSTGQRTFEVVSVTYQ